MSRIRRGVLTVLTFLPIVSVAFAAQAALSGVPSATDSEKPPTGGTGPSYAS